MNAVFEAIPGSVHQAGLEAELDSLLAARWAPASWQRVDKVEELPWRLQQLVVTLAGGVWRAYADGACVALATAEALGPRQLAVRFHDGSGQLCAAGAWSRDATGDWQLSKIIG